MNFRYDINGLRAIAVLAVVLFHFNPQWLPGGFAGVDVFFVISGFLMTSIIFSGVEKNTFNLFKFYNARANRIVPVLAAMSAVLLVFGWFYLLPTDYRDLGRQVEKSALFVSNLLFAKGGGYFDTAEHTKWLLHTWSLSVEWQFYIFFPIIIIALKKYLSFSNLKRVVLGLFLASFIYCIYATYKDSKTAYFLLTSRAWEMLLGGLAFLYPWSLKNKLHQIFTQCLGIILIVASYFLMSKDTPWPGYMALIPVLGAYLIVVANYQNNFLINNPISNSIGKWSYSIYVWHWPLVVLGFYFAFENWWIYGIPLSILLGFLSYQFIEKINFSRYSSWKEIYKVKPFYIFLIVLACGYVVKETDGVEFKNSQYVKAILKAKTDTNQYNCITNWDTSEIYECVIGNKNNIKAIVIGDSHANAIITAITSIYNLAEDGVILISTHGCPLLTKSQYYDSKNKCPEQNIKRFNMLKQNKYPDAKLILIGRWSYYIHGDNDPALINPGEGIRPIIYFNNDKKMSINEKYTIFNAEFQKTLCRATKLNTTYVLLPIPEMPINIPEYYAKNKLKNINQPFVLNLKDYYSRSNNIIKIIKSNAKICNAEILDPTEILCKHGKCISEYNNFPIYQDGNHLNQNGSKLLIPLFKKALTE